MYICQVRHITTKLFTTQSNKIMGKYDLVKIKDLLSTRLWRWAKTYLSIPHEYIVRGKCGLSDNEFLYIVHAQRDLGVYERWGKYNFPYLYVDGYKYWTMGDTFENTIIINRQKVFSEFDTLDMYNKGYTNREAKEIAECVMNTFKSPVFEAGFGYGSFVKDSQISANDYYGVDPSQKAIDYFRANNLGFYKKVSKKSFEESIEKWRIYDGVIIALFGSASYLMPAYLRLLDDSDRDYFLMFYKEGYVPDELTGMHHFVTSKEVLMLSFLRAKIQEYGNYYIVSTKDFKIKPIISYIQNDLFSI